MRTIASIRQDILNRAYELIHMTGGDSCGRGGTCTLEELYANVIYFAKKSSNIRLPKPYIAGIRKAELEDFEDNLDKFAETFSYHGLIPTKKFTFNYDTLLLKNVKSTSTNEPETGDQSRTTETTQGEHSPTETDSGRSQDNESDGSETEPIAESTTVIPSIGDHFEPIGRRDQACSPVFFESIVTPTNTVRSTPENPEVALFGRPDSPRDCQEKETTEQSINCTTTNKKQEIVYLNITNQIGHNAAQTPLASIPQRLKIF